MKKKIFVLFLAWISIFSAMGLAGCGNQPDSQAENTLTLMAKESDFEKVYIQRAIDLYEDQTDVKIEGIVIPDVDYEEEAEERFKKGDIPDLFQCFNSFSLNNYNVPENFYYMNDEEWIGELTDGARTYCLDSEGNILGLPFWESSISGCYYNKKLLDELGLKPAATQAEFDALCQALKSIGYTPLYWAANGCNWIFQFGLDPIFADNPDILEQLNKNQITYADIPAAVQMVEWLDGANKKGWFNGTYADADWDDIAPAMENGEAVCVFIWDTWFSTDFHEGNKYSSGDFALMPVFMGTADSGTYEGGNMNMLMANKNSPKLELALDFLSFCARPENYNAAFDGVFTVNCFEGQTTNIQSSMVTDAEVSIQANQRPSVTWTKVIGYSPDDVGDAMVKLFQGKVDVAGCIELMDEYRINSARELGAEGF